MAEAAARAEEEKISFEASIHGIKLKPKVGATKFTAEERQSLSEAMQDFIQKTSKKGEA